MAHNIRGNVRDDNAGRQCIQRAYYLCGEHQAAGYSQLAGVMPSATAPGNATVQLTYNGVASNAFATTILANNFGISTLNEAGNGTAVITYQTTTAPFYGVVSRTNSAVPGNTYTMWGTGPGPATGGNSDTNASVAGDVGPPVTVLVGGISAAVTYYGQSPGSGPGLDQINFTIRQDFRAALYRWWC